MQEFSLGKYDAEATAAFNQNVSHASTMKERYIKLWFYFCFNVYSPRLCISETVFVCF